MSDGGARRSGGESGWPLLALLALGAAGLWVLYWMVGAHPLLGRGPVQEGLRVAATLATALLAVLAGGRAALGLGLSAGLGVEPTGLQRAMAYGLLTFVASAVVLASFGFDITAVLTTSAILTAAVGLAMQPTLGSLISGVALHMDRVLRVGDTIVLDDRLVEITRLDWRTAIGRRKDGTVVVVPNARISNETLVVYPAGQPARLDTVFPAPATVPPQRITELVSELITDFPQVNTAFPVMVMLDGHEPEHAAVRYRARYWVRNLWDRPEIGSEVLRRVWYAFQRHGIPWPASRLHDAGRRMPRLGDLVPGGAALTEAVAAVLPPFPGRDNTQTAHRLAEAGELLLYAPDERIVVPARCAGRAFLLLSGTAQVEPIGTGVLADAMAPPPLPIQRLGRAATLRRVADALARHVGPYADHAVRSAATRATTLAALSLEVAGEIEDPRRREQFLAELEGEDETSLWSGVVFRARRDAAGRLGADPPLRAAEEVTVLAVPSELVEQLSDPVGCAAKPTPAPSPK